MHEQVPRVIFLLLALLAAVPADAEAHRVKLSTAVLASHLQAHRSNTTVLVNHSMKASGRDVLLLAAPTPGSIGQWLAIIALSLLVVFFLSLSLVLCCLGRLAKSFIQQYDRGILGTEVTIGRLSINPFNLCIKLRDFKVLNPAGTAYLSDYMLRAEYLMINIRFRTLLWSIGRKVSVQKLVVRNTQVLVEKHSIQTSNVKELLGVLNNDTSVSPRSGHQVQSPGQGDLQARDEGARPTSCRVVLRAVRFEGISVKLQVEGNAFGFGERRLLAAQTLTLDDILYDDFDSQVGSSEPSELVAVLLRSLLKRIVAGVSGLDLSDRWF